MKKLKLPIWMLIVAAMTYGCDTLMTDQPPAGDDFESPLDGLSNDLNAVFAAGDENFEKGFTVGEGLGPIEITPPLPY